MDFNPYSKNEKRNNFIIKIKINQIFFSIQVKLINLNKKRQVWSFLNVFNEGNMPFKDF